MPKRAKIERSVNYQFYADVLWCCVPLLVMSCYYYGPRPALLALFAVTVAYLCDCLLAPLHGAGYRPHEPSSECFAALIVMLLPATVPYHVVATAVVAAVLIKETFGGEGHYPFHPAAFGLVVAGISWPDQVFRYPSPGTALPLWAADDVALVQGMNTTLKSGGLPTASTINLLTGNVVGPIGTCAVLVVCACGLYLLCRQHLSMATLVPYFVMLIGIPWLLPQLNELPAFSLPWEYVRQRVYLEKYILLSGTALFGGIFLACEPVTMPNRTVSRMIYGTALGIATVVFRYYSDYETSVCFALLIVGAIPEWLDYLSRRAEHARFMKKEEERFAKQANKRQ